MSILAPFSQYGFNQLMNTAKPSLPQSSQLASSRAAPLRHDQESAILDGIEGDLDDLKRELAKIRVDRSAFPSPAPDAPSSSTATALTAAARLQQQHEMMSLVSNHAQPPLESPAPPPPTPQEFPVLGQTSHEAQRQDTVVGSSGRRQSYASIATQGVSATAEQALPQSKQDAGNVVSFQQFPSSPIRVSSAETSSSADLAANAVLSLSYSVEHMDSPEPARMESGLRGASKQAPHFAQPTASFARRADETLHRKDSISSKADRSSPDVSPSKLSSVRTFAQQLHKRKSIPGDWMNNPSRPEPTIRDVNDENNGTFSRLDLTADSTSQHSTLASPLRKKTSSYMSPTKAVTQRTIATLGQENSKRQMPKLQRPLARINTSIPCRQGPLTPESASGSLTSPVTVIETEMRTFPALDGLLNKARRGTQTRIPGFDHGSENGAPIARRQTVGLPVAEILADRARAAGLPMPANTIAKRRVSHGSILLPIMAKLDKIGILKGGFRTIDATPENTIQEEPLQSPQGRETISSPMAEVVPTKKCVPPHRRFIGRDNATGPAVPKMTPSLRATALEFKPILRFDSPMELEKPLFSHPSAVDMATALKVYSDDEWAKLSPLVKKSIIELRHVRNNGLQSPTAAQYAVSGQQQANQLQWNTQQSEQMQAMSPDVFNSNASGVQVGQVLKPHVDPESHAVNWTVRNALGKELAINFGRAGAQIVGSPGNGSVLSTSSPNPNVVLPQRTPGSASRGWTVGSTPQARELYGWTGGDGREIKFVRYGPHAERDPNTPINFRMSGAGETSKLGCGSDETEPPLAPRSRRQWAERMGYDRIPCNTIEITHAIEHMPLPFGDRLAGYCYDCAAGDR